MQEFLQYADGMSSSTVGGSLTPLAVDPKFAPVCLCGMLAQPQGYHPRRHQLSSEQQSFRESREKAREYQLLQSEVEERIQKRLQAAINPEYIKQLAARVEAAEKRNSDQAVELKGRHLKPRRKKRKRHDEP